MTRQDVSPYAMGRARIAVVAPILPMSIRLIMFDLDGTLFDTVADMTDAVNDVLPPGIPPVSLEESRIAMGGGGDTLIARLKWPDLDWKTFGKKVSDAYAARLGAHTRPYPGVAATLKRLSFCSKVVLTNRSTVNTIPVLERFKLLPYFLDVIGRDSGAGMKPSPDPVLHVLKRLSVKPEEAVIVGDCAQDIEAGRAAGVRTVAVTYGYGYAVDCGFVEQADSVIDRFPRLLQVIEGLDHPPRPAAA